MSELERADDLAEGTPAILLGDRTDWSPRLRAERVRYGIELVGPSRSALRARPFARSANRDPHPRGSRMLSRFRYRISTVFGQLSERCSIKGIWARDRWHLVNRVLRHVLVHTLGVWLNRHLGKPPLHWAQLVA